MKLASGFAAFHLAAGSNEKGSWLTIPRLPAVCTVLIKYCRGLRSHTKVNSVYTHGGIKERQPTSETDRIANTRANEGAEHRCRRIPGALNARVKRAGCF